MATRDEREEVTRKLACLAKLVFARAGPPGIADHVVCVTGTKGGVEEVIRFARIDLIIITIRGKTPKGEDIHVSSDEGYEDLRYELKPCEPQNQVSAQQMHLCLAAS